MNECIILSDGLQISVQFLQDIEVEEELLLSIKTPSSTEIGQVWVQGINMYMGKSAVLANSIYLEEGKKVHNASMFLGSCSEPFMRWQLIIETIDDKQKKQTWFFNFSTDRNKES
jgi:hypothetical protein